MNVLIACECSQTVCKEFRALGHEDMRLIAMTTQKTAGQKKGINWSELDMVLMSIVIEATALVQSGVLDEIEAKEE